MYASEARRAAEDILRLMPRGSKVPHARRAVGLAELPPVGAQQEGMMQIARGRVVPKESAQPELTPRRREDVFASDHQINALIDVVHDVAELVGVVAPSVAQEEVAALRIGVLRLRPETQVVEVLGAAVDPYTPSRDATRIETTVTAGTGISSLVADVGARGVAGIGKASCFEFGESLGVAVGTLALAERR